MKSNETPSSIYDRLFERIFSGDFQPGGRLIERVLAEELGVSRIPVREALGQMVGQGILIGGEKRRSVRIRQYTTEELIQLFAFREMVEGGAARAAAGRADADQVQHIGNVCREMEAMVGRQRFGEKWTTLDHTFHDLIAHAGGNQWFAATLHRLLRQCQFVFYRLRLRDVASLSDEQVRTRMSRVVEAHGKVLERIIARDGDGAEQAMREHIRQSFRNSSILPRPAGTADNDVAVPAAALSRTAEN